MVCALLRSLLCIPFFWIQNDNSTTKFQFVETIWWLSYSNINFLYMYRWCLFIFVVLTTFSIPIWRTLFALQTRAQLSSKDFQHSIVVFGRSMSLSHVMIHCHVITYEILQWFTWKVKEHQWDSPNMNNWFEYSLFGENHFNYGHLCDDHNFDNQLKYEFLNLCHMDILSYIACDAREAIS